jgi:hypothetical protein
MRSFETLFIASAFVSVSFRRASARGAGQDMGLAYNGENNWAQIIYLRTFQPPIAFQPSPDATGEKVKGASASG